MGAGVSVQADGERHALPELPADGAGGGIECKSPRNLLALEDSRHGMVSADPWASFAPEVVLDMVKAEEGFTIFLEAMEEWAKKLDSAPPGGLRVLAEDAELNDDMLQDMCVTATQSQGGVRIMTLLLPNNEVEDARCLEVPNQIRSLNLSGNPLCGVPTLLGCTCMVDLDLSYCPGMQLQQADSPPFLHLGSLLRLNLTSVGLTSLHGTDNKAALLGGLVKLRELSLAENELVELDDVVAGLSRLKFLEALELQDNPVRDDSGYRPDVLQASLPCLAVLDNKNLRRTWNDKGEGKVGASESMSRRARLNMDADARLVIGDAPAAEQEAAEAMRGHVDTTPVA